MKKALNTAHKWAGLFVGVLFLLQAITGLTMVYREPLTALLNANARVGTGTPAPLDALFAAIARAEPGGQLERITYPADHTIAATARIIMPDKTVHIALINPEKGTVISSGPLWRYPVELSNRVHTSLLMGTTGNVILALEGLTLAFMAITGLIVWWPRAGRIVYALTIHRKAPWRRLLRDLHVVPGAIIAVFLLISSTTGILMIADPVVIAAVSKVAAVEAPPNLKIPKQTDPTQSQISAQQAIETLHARFPNAWLRQIRPFYRERVVGALFVENDAPNPRTHNMAMVDRLTGELRIFQDAATVPAGTAAIDWLLPIHSGEVYGIMRRVIMSMVGLTLAFLVISGFTMWLSKRRYRP